MDDMEKSFRDADFSRGKAKLEERIWQRIARAIEESADEHELTDEELMLVAAAGSPHVKKPEDKK